MRVSDAVSLRAMRHRCYVAARTDTEYGSDDYLFRITAPGGLSQSFTYYAGEMEGLLKTRTTPRGFTYNYLYDDDGRISADVDPLDGILGYDYTHFDSGHEVQKTSAEGLLTSYRSEHLSTGDEYMQNTFPGGLQTTSTTFTDGTRELHFPERNIVNPTNRQRPLWRHAACADIRR